MKYKESKVYECMKCDLPEVFYEEDDVLKHLENCLFNEDNKTCMTCDNLELQILAPTGKNRQKWRDRQVGLSFGSMEFKKAYCTKYNKYLKEDEILDYPKSCHVLNEGEPKKTLSKEAKDFWNKYTQ